MLSALKKEIALRQEELGNEPIETIYFGGGTPSILEVEAIDALIESIHQNFPVIDTPEITLEANPDDLSKHQIKKLAKSAINRLSIGVQSFFDEDLKLMNRAHNSNEAEVCIAEALEYFDNISIDLIYGIPGCDDQKWSTNIEKALGYNLPHVSSYALTVEPKTALQGFIEKGVVPNVDEEQAQRQFYQLVDILEASGFVNYETSNFGKPGYFSKNNTAYWQGKKYLGIGPSAHSFDGLKRGWNVRNNTKYIQALDRDKLPIEYEFLTKRDRYNEYVMTGLRTIWGVSLKKIKEDFGQMYADYLSEQAAKYLNQHLLFWDDEVLLTTKKGKFLADGIAADLFMLNLKK